jgi:hypothetical protein
MLTTIALAGVWVALTAGLTRAWLPEAVLAVARVGLPTAVAATLLVLYFDWRRRLMRRVRADDNHHDVGEKGRHRHAIEWRVRETALRPQ